MFFSLKFIVSFPAELREPLPERERLHPAKGMIPTTFRNYRSSAKGYHLIDTFSASTGNKPGKNLIPHTSRFCRTWMNEKTKNDTNLFNFSFIIELYKNMKYKKNFSNI